MPRTLVEAVISALSGNVHWSPGLDKIAIKSSVETALKDIFEDHSLVGVFIIAYFRWSAFNSHFKQISTPGGRSDF